LQQIEDAEFVRSKRLLKSSLAKLHSTIKEKIGTILQKSKEEVNTMM
jgi:hypothetical protein